MLKMKNVSFKRGKKNILTDINWQVSQHDNWAILGLNGSGKTTLLQLITGYLWASSGSLTVLGKEFGKTSIPELRKKIGWVSSSLQYQINENDLSEQIVLSGKFASIGLYKNVMDAELAEARNILIEAGGSPLIGKPYSILSQGERQIVLIARAMMAQPELLILDEPCNGLDLFAREKLLQQIAAITEFTTAPTILFVTHHSEEILPCFTNTLLLRDGIIHQKGATESILTEKNLSHFYGQKIALNKLHDGRVMVYPN